MIRRVLIASAATLLAACGQCGGGDAPAAPTEADASADAGSSFEGSGGFEAYVPSEPAAAPAEAEAAEEASDDEPAGRPGLQTGPPGVQRVAREGRTLNLTDGGERQGGLLEQACTVAAERCLVDDQKTSTNAFAYRWEIDPEGPTWVAEGLVTDERLSECLNDVLPRLEIDERRDQPDSAVGSVVIDLDDNGARQVRCVLTN